MWTQAIGDDVFTDYLRDARASAVVETAHLDQSSRGRVADGGDVPIDTSRRDRQAQVWREGRVAHEHETTPALAEQASQAPLRPTRRRPPAGGGCEPDDQTESARAEQDVERRPCAMW